MSTIKEGLNIPKKKHPIAVEDMGGYYQINSEILIGLIENAILAFDGEVSYREISEYDNNAMNFDIYFMDSYNDAELEQFLWQTVPAVFTPLFKPIVDIEYTDTEEGSHLFSLHVVYNKELRDENYVNESILSYRKPLSNYVFNNSKHLKEQLITKYYLPKSIIDKTFKQSPSKITESLLQVLDKKTIKLLLKENPLKCTIGDVEKRAKKIVFVKYNWDPKNVVFSTERDVVQITAMDDLKPELQQVSDDEVIFKFLESLSNGYRKDLNSEFTGFCNKIKFLSSLTSDISSQVYCYTIIQQADGTYFFSSNREKKKLKKSNHPQYTLNKLYYKIGLFASNVKIEGLNVPKKNINTPEQWFDNLFLQMDQATKPDRPNSIFFHINGEIYMEYDQNLNILWYHYYKIYQVLESKYYLNYEHINEIVKGTVEEHTNLRGFTPRLEFNGYITRVEEHTNLRGFTPDISAGLLWD